MTLVGQCPLQIPISRQIVHCNLDRISMVTLASGLCLNLSLITNCVLKWKIKTAENKSESKCKRWKEK
jgi:hypothetical protein